MIEHILAVSNPRSTAINNYSSVVRDLLELVTQLAPSKIHKPDIIPGSVIFFLRYLANLTNKIHCIFNTKNIIFSTKITEN